MTNPVFLADPAALAASVPGTDTILEGPEARHAVTVRRIAVDETVDLVDGAGRRVTGTVAAAAPDRLQVAVDAVTDEPAPLPPLVLVQALAKGDRDLAAVEAATELGIDAVVPWQAERSISRWRAEKAEKGRRKWEAITTAALKQSRRSRLPVVTPLADGRRLAALADRAALTLVLHETATVSLAEAVSGLPPAAPPGIPTPGLPIEAASEGNLEAAPEGNSGGGTGSGGTGGLGVPGLTEAILIIVGPEGGISAGELEALAAAGGIPVRMGPHVLRSSTAGPAAVAVLSHLLGRWT